MLRDRRQGKEFGARASVILALLVVTALWGRSAASPARAQVPGALNASLTAAPTSAQVGQPVTFTYRASPPAVAPPFPGVSLVIEFGDGASSGPIEGVAGQTVQGEVVHSYQAPGTYTATLMATASNGQAGTATATVRVTEQCGPPMVTVSAAPSAATVGQAITFSYAAVAGAGCTMETAPLPTLLINFGDGSAPLPLNEPSGSIMHSYTTPGEYTVSVTALSGGQTGQGSATVSVTTQPVLPPSPPPAPPPPSPAAQPTAVNVVQPTGTSGADLGTAETCGSSAVLLRPGVWRCNTIDPCFSVPGVTTYVVCDVDLATGLGQKLNLAQPLDPASGHRDVQVSAMRLDLENGATCTYQGGATFAFQGQRANYQCDDGTWIAGQPQPGLIWTVTVGRAVTMPMPALDPATVTTVAVRVAWV
jgi:PKD repeat protein